jgi:hypothetical protein
MITFLNMKLEELLVRVDEIYTEFNEEFFAVLGQEVDPMFADDSPAES